MFLLSRTSFRDGAVEACSSFLDYLRSQIVQFLKKNVLNKSLLQRVFLSLLIIPSSIRWSR